MKNILVPIDFNDSEKVLMNKALEFSMAFKAKIWLLHVASPEPEFVGFGVGPQYIRESRAEELRKEHRLLNDYAAKIRLKGQQCEGLLISGATIEMILEKADKLEIDLIITGHHDHSIFYQLFFGSISKGVLKKTNIPVLIVPIKEYKLN
ncbi:universal stress protein [Lutimonas sp.]|uniref:universal stress protein n=1 Tax=Lutimonas sp. TaxID=1872403 RepID=UPI003D9B8E7A